MKAIYASKLYRTSNRKDKIHSALSDPLNSELVKQLSSYLDEEYQTPENLGQDVELSEKEIADVENFAEDSISEDRTVSEGSPNGGGGGMFSSPTSFDDDFDLGDFESTTSDSSDLKEESDSDTPGLVVEEESVEESTNLRRRFPVMSCAAASALSTDVILGTLNGREDTSGVSRVVITPDNSELWIYYSDKINLNNIMDQVINIMLASNYSNVEFNRLARSDNAIVFQINSLSSSTSICDEE